LNCQYTKNIIIISLLSYPHIILHSFCLF